MTGTNFHSAMLLLKYSLEQLWLGLPILLERGLYRFGQCILVALDGQQIVTALIDNHPGDIGLAGHCIDSYSEQLAEVKKLRAEGEALHNAGKHQESVDTLAKAMAIVAPAKT